MGGGSRWRGIQPASAFLPWVWFVDKNPRTEEEPGDQEVSHLAESALWGYELHVTLFSFGYSKRMRPWILRNRSWKLLNPSLLPQVPWSNRPRQPRGSWWPRERCVNPTGQVVESSHSKSLWILRKRRYCLCPDQGSRAAPSLPDSPGCAHIIGYSVCFSLTDRMKGLASRPVICFLLRRVSTPGSHQGLNKTFIFPAVH